MVDSTQFAQVEEQLLRIEALKGLTSPEELAQQRLQVQVNELKLALQNRDTNNHYLTHLFALCTLPVQMNVQQEQRMHIILEDYVSNFDNYRA